MRRTAVRKGMVIVARPDDSAGPAAVPRAVRRFEGQVLVLYHNTTIQPGYQAVRPPSPPPRLAHTVRSPALTTSSCAPLPGYVQVMHTGAVRQTCRIITMDHPKGVLRTGDRASAVFEFCSAPEVRSPPPLSPSFLSPARLRAPRLTCCALGARNEQYVKEGDKLLFREGKTKGLVRPPFIHAFPSPCPLEHAGR